MKYTLAIFIYCVLLSRSGLSQNLDTLTVAERNEFRRVLLNTGIGYSFLADSFSKRGDSVMASKYLLKISPYYFMFDRQMPETIDSFLDANFKITNSAKKTYHLLYIGIYNEPRSEIYKKLKSFYEDDQLERDLQEKCGDSVSCALMERRLRIDDSIHFAFLFDYVKKNGWPKLSDGAMFANLLAIHDHEHHAYYIPIMKAAVKNGTVDLDALELAIYWNSQAWQFKQFDKELKKNRYAVFNVSSMLNWQLPASLPRIQSYVKKHCPVHVFLFFETEKNRTYADWVNNSWLRASKSRLGKYQGHIFSQFIEQLHLDCPKSLYDGLWEVTYKPEKIKGSRLKFYVLY
jgi:hypothetical protein